MRETSKLLSVYKLVKAAGLPGYLLLFNNVLIFFVKRRRTLEDYSSVDTSALLQILFTFIIFGLACHTLIFTSSIRGKLLMLRPNIFLVLYIVVCFLSVLWSPKINLSLYRAFETLTFLVLISWTAFNLSARLDPQNMIEWIVFWGVWCIFWSIATNIKLLGLNYLAYPFYAARLEYPVVIFFALFLSKRKLFKYIILIFALFSFSNKIYLGFALGLFSLFFGNSKSKIVISSFALALVCITLFIDFESLINSTVFIGREEVSIEYSSGRDKVWGLAWSAFKESPFVGYGFVAGESAILWDKFKGAINTHSFLFSGLLGTGILGTVFLIQYYFSIFKIGFNKHWPQNNWKAAVIGTLIMSLVVSLSAPGLGGRVYGSWISVVLIISFITALNYKFKALKKLNQTT